MTLSQIEKMKSLLTLLEKTSALHHLVLIGSWSEIVYEELCLGFKTNTRTLDADFLCLAHKKRL